MEKDFRAEIGALVENRKQAYTDMSDRIWGFAEPRFQELSLIHISEPTRRS